MFRPLARTYFARIICKVRNECCFPGKHTIRAKYHSRTLTGQFTQDDSRADDADSRKQAVML